MERESIAVTLRRVTLLNAPRRGYSALRRIEPDQSHDADQNAVPGKRCKSVTRHNRQESLYANCGE